MKITICGSMKFFQEMRVVKKKLENLGHTVLVPKDLDIENNIPVEAQQHLSTDELIAAKIEYDFIRDHFKKINEADAILVLNYEKKGIPNYIGGNTFLEMGLAFWLGKKIFLLHPVPDSMEYMTEMHAMQPVVLHGDITKIGKDHS